MGIVLTQGRMRQRKKSDWDGLHLPYAVPKLQRATNPHCLYGYEGYEIHLAFKLVQKEIISQKD